MGTKTSLKSQEPNSPPDQIAVSPNPSPLILLLEDTAHSNELFTLWFTSHGYDVTSFQSGEGAVIEATTRMFGPERFDAALLDIALPYFSGVQVCRQIREAELKRPEQSPMWIGFVTGYSRDVAEGKLLDEVKGMYQGFYEKPLDLSVVMTDIERWWEERIRSHPES